MIPLDNQPAQGTDSAAFHDLAGAALCEVRDLCLLFGRARFLSTDMMRVLLLIITLVEAQAASLAPLEAASITGNVKFAGPVPQLPAVKVSKDQDYCGDALPNETYLIDSASGFRNVVVYIEAAPAAAAPDPRKLNIVENTGCRYAPRILAMQKGERLSVRNNDPKLHIPHSYLNERTVFMLSLPFKNSMLDATQKIREAGILKLVCDTHAWMLGFIHVFDHSYFAVTDEKGAFSIPNVPPGAYILKAWHEDAGVKSQEVIVSEGSEARVDFEFGPK